MPPNAGFIYAIQAEGTPYVKIGQTRRQVEERLKALQTGQPFALTILAAIKIEQGLEGLERRLHQALASQRRTGEWFELTLDAEQFVQLVTETGASVVQSLVHDPDGLYYNRSSFFWQGGGRAKCRKRPGVLISVHMSTLEGSHGTHTRPRRCRSAGDGSTPVLRCRLCRALYG